MNPHEQELVVAVFPDQGSAEAAIDELWHFGFPPAQIGIAVPGKPLIRGQTSTGGIEDTAAKGTTTGAITGGALGALLGAVAVGAIPGIGPVLAGGVLAGIVTGGAAGAALGVFLGPFVAMGMSEQQARHYEQHLQAGRTVVVLQTADREAEARTILHKHGGIDDYEPAHLVAAKEWEHTVSH